MYQYIHTYQVPGIRYQGIRVSGTGYQGIGVSSYHLDWEVFSHRSILQTLSTHTIPLEITILGAAGELGKTPTGCPEYITKVCSSVRLAR